MNLYFSREGCASGGMWSLSNLPNYMPLAPQMRHTLFAQTPSSHYYWEPPAVLFTRLAFLLGGHATVSNLYGTRERALGHRHLCTGQILPTKEFLEVGLQQQVTLNLPLCLPQVSTSWTHYLAPSHLPGWQGQLVGLIYPGIPFQAILG